MIKVPLSIEEVPWFFDASHYELATRIRDVAAKLLAAEALPDEDARNAACVTALASADLLRIAVPSQALDVRALCLVRQGLGYVSPRADSIFAVTGLGCTPMRTSAYPLDVTPYQRGEHVAAFLLTEPGAGSDLASLQTRATQSDDHWLLSGEKCFISNAGLASHGAVLATVDPALGHKGIACFWVDLRDEGVQVTQTPAAAPHPLGTIRLDNVRVPAERMIAAPGAGFRAAMATLDAFRVSVGAAALGMARRSFDEALKHVRSRVQFGKPLADQPLVQAHLADMHVDLDASMLLVLRAAYQKDHGTGATRHVSIAKLAATEASQRVIDTAVQLCGGQGVLAGHVCELMYRAIRPLRIYEGTSEIQRTIIGRDVVKGSKPT